jgi:hypothetical protein
VQAPPQRPARAQGQQQVQESVQESVQGPGPAQGPTRAQEPAQAQAGKTVRSRPYWKTPKTLMGARDYIHQEKNAVAQRPWRTEQPQKNHQQHD